MSSALSSQFGSGSLPPAHAGCTPPSDPNLQPTLLLAYATNAAMNYCVPLDLILAIIGAESDYGRNLGSNNQGLGQLTTEGLEAIERKVHWRPDPMNHEENILGVAALLHVSYYGDCELGADGKTWVHYKPGASYNDWVKTTSTYNGPGYAQGHPTYLPSTYREFVGLHLGDHFVASDGGNHGRCSIWDYFDRVGVNQPWYANARTPGLKDGLGSGTKVAYHPDPVNYLSIGCAGQQPADDVNCKDSNYSWALGRP